jgi:ABC-type bacteriocin/lantibiotic exporter with double-glycine peptidase domain
MFNHLLNSYGRLSGVWIGILFTLFATTAIRIFAPFILSLFLTSVALDGLADTKYLVLFFGSYVTGIILHFVADQSFIATTDRRYEFLVGQLFDRMLKMNPKFHRTAMQGEIGSIFRDHMDGTINFFRILRSDLLPISLTILVSSLIIMYYNFLAAVLFIAAMAAQAMLSHVAIRITKPARADTKKVYRRLTGVFGDYIANFEIVKVSGRAEWFTEKITSLASQEGALFWARHRLTFRFELLANLLTASCLARVLLVLGRAELSPEDFYRSAFIAAVFSFQGMLLAQGMGDLLQRLAEHWNNAKQTLSLLESNKPVACSSSPKKVTFEDRAFAFSDVTAGYSPDETVYDGLNLDLLVGSHAIVVGPNGAGKSTLFKLLLGFLEPLNGKVVLGDPEGEAESPEDLFRYLSYLPQNSALVSGTLRENILLFNSEANDTFLQKCVEIVGLESEISAQNLSLDQDVGESGNLLSGGQRQRVGIARCILKEAEIYLLDEPTSALPDSEAVDVMKQILELLAGKTVIVISHSENIQNLFATRIVVSSNSLTLEA